MKIHLRQIPPDGTHLAGEEECPIPEMEAEGIRCLGPLRYALDLGISDGDVWATGTLSQPIEVKCVACLEPFTYPIEVHAFAAHIEAPTTEAVDLTPYIREELLLNLVPHPRCDQHGGKVCRAAAPPARTEDEFKAIAEKREHDWEALNKLKLKP